MIPFLPYSSEKVNDNFISLGVFLPLLHFHYRLFFWYSDLYTLFNPASCSPALCRFLEPLALCYLPTFLLFFLIREKNHFFFLQGVGKNPPFFPVLLRFNQGGDLFVQKPTPWVLFVNVMYLVLSFSCILGKLFYAFQDSFVVFKPCCA